MYFPFDAWYNLSLTTFFVYVDCNNLITKRNLHSVKAALFGDVVRPPVNVGWAKSSIRANTALHSTECRRNGGPCILTTPTADPTILRSKGS